MGPSRPNPLGGWRLREISLSFVVDDAPASPPRCPLHRLLLSSRPHLAKPIRIRYRIYEREYLVLIGSFHRRWRGGFGWGRWGRRSRFFLKESNADNPAQSGKEGGDHKVGDRRNQNHSHAQESAREDRFQNGPYSLRDSRVAESLFHLGKVGDSLSELQLDVLKRNTY